MSVMRKHKKGFANYTYLNARIVFLLSAFVHLAVTAVVTLSIDTRVDDDPRVKAYYYTRWKLLTCWFNLVTLAYLPARLYCDWRTKQGAGDSTLVSLLYHASDVVMTGLLFPVTLFSVMVFWFLYYWNIDLLAPPRLWDYLPTWAQHSLHTVSFFVVLLDLVLTPRRRPASLKPRIALLLSFSFLYIWVIYTSYLNGELVYAFIEGVSSIQFALMAALSMGFTLLLFAAQWVAINFLWGTKSKRTIS